MAKRWAQNNKRSYLTYEANWSAQGKAAGPIRNHKMLEENPTAVVVAFSGGKGTKHCKDTAIGLNMIVLEVK
jgi:hypothetical protein